MIIWARGERPRRHCSVTTHRPLSDRTTLALPSRPAFGAEKDRDLGEIKCPLSEQMCLSPSDCGPALETHLCPGDSPPPPPPCSPGPVCSLSCNFSPSASPCPLLPFHSQTHLLPPCSLVPAPRLVPEVSSSRPTGSQAAPTSQAQLPGSPCDPRKKAPRSLALLQGPFPDPSCYW